MTTTTSWQSSRRTADGGPPGQPRPATPASHQWLENDNRGVLTPRRLGQFWSLVLVATLGLAGIISGLWFLIKPLPEWMPYQVTTVGPVGGVVGGVVILGFAIFESARRFRHGPPAPGRHSP